jgi:hypothetical protein
MADDSNTLNSPRERSTRTGMRPLGFILMYQGSCRSTGSASRVEPCKLPKLCLLGVIRYVDLFEADHWGQPCFMSCFTCSLIINGWINGFQILQKERYRKAIRGGCGVQEKWLCGIGHYGVTKQRRHFINAYEPDESASHKE